MHAYSHKFIINLIIKDVQHNNLQLIKYVRLFIVNFYRAHGSS